MSTPSNISKNITTRLRKMTFFAKPYETPLQLTRKHKQCVEEISKLYTRMYTSIIFTVIKEPYSLGFSQPLRAHNTDLTDKSALTHMSLEDNTHQPRQHQDKTRQLMVYIETEKSNM